ncbi:MAG: anti-sigma factor [Actinomycetota bacterium]
MSDENLQLDEAEARIDAILRDMSIDDLELDTPPDDVWSGIEAALTAEADADAPLAPVVSLATRRRPALVAAAVAAALVLIAGLAFVVTGEDDPNQLEVASAELVYVDDPANFSADGVGRSADATLVEEGGRDLVRVDRADLPAAPEDTDLEIWLIGAASDGTLDIQTLGLVADPTGGATYDVPADFDVDAFDAVFVDVSYEPRDGDPDHSGVSLIRGALTEV